MIMAQWFRSGGGAVHPLTRRYVCHQHRKANVIQCYMIIGALDGDPKAYNWRYDEYHTETILVAYSLTRDT
ncbi:hypothetical protein D3H41_09520 [Vibrio neocaledonicus]|nr:hypothetical protein D3H41_09520 [Vibrio neocaledonicus]